MVLSVCAITMNPFSIFPAQASESLTFTLEGATGNGVACYTLATKTSSEVTAEMMKTRFRRRVRVGFVRWNSETFDRANLRRGQ